MCTTDEKEFGAERWVYCKSHVGPHMTGWCTVCTSDKVLLNATSHTEAVQESKDLGFKIFGESA